MAKQFLDSKELRSQNDILNYINYQNINQEHREFLRSDTWDFEWTQPAAAVYFPGNDLLKSRMQAINTQFPVMIGQMMAQIRNFTLFQNTISGTTAGNFSIDYMDFEDQAIKMWLDDWRDKLGGRSDRYAFRKEDTFAQAKLTLMNSSRKPIMVYEIFTIQPVDSGNLMNPMLSSDDPQNIGQVSATFSFEHFEARPLNI